MERSFPARRPRDFFARIFGHSDDGNNAIAIMAKAPFYKNGDIIHVIYGDRETGVLIAAGTGDVAGRELFPLRGQGKDIHEANRVAGLALNEANVFEYLEFFCGMIAGRETGCPFRIMQSLDGVVLCDGEPPRDMTMRMTMEAKPGRPVRYLFQGYMEYEMQLFRAGLIVEEDGMVVMIDDDHVGELRPVRH